MDGKLEGALDLPTRELALLDLWRRERLADRANEHRIGAKPWVTFEGPPTVNGDPALHHVFTSTHKDIYARFQTMRGRYVERRAGWDCQGLPVEINVERKLGLRDKQAVEDYGVDRFVDACRAFVDTHIVKFENVFERIGFWVDFGRAYRTMDATFIESVWWHLKQLHAAGELYEGQKVVPYCTRCGTALSSHELGQPGVYVDRTDTSAYVAMPLRDDSTSLLIWTTTPWTLPSNVAVAVDPERDYGVYESPVGPVIVSVDHAADVLGPDAPEPTQLMRGTELVGRRYESPYGLVADGEREIVVAYDGVEANVGSGLVHIAPAFGEADAALGVANGLAVVNPVDPAGRYTAAFAAHVGESVHDVGGAIIQDLQARGLLLGAHQHTHSYPHCWRCKTPLIYWAKPSWYIRTSAHRDQLVAENHTVDWHPETIKEGRFGNWLRGNIDWALSRDRFWGTPLPLWRCENGHVECIGSRADLAARTGRDAESIPTHRPEIDAIQFVCPDCGEQMRRVEAVGDVWLDSGCVPAAQWGYPSLPDSDGFTREFPADFISEAIDQTRGWFYSLLAVNTLVHGGTPFRHVVCLGLLVDEDGRKMSKSVGNVIEPNGAIERFGADGLRWYLLAAASPWGTRRVSFDAIQQRVTRDLDTLWNVATFYKQYADAAGEQAHDAPSEQHTLDRWILSRTDAVVEAVTDALEDYSPHIGADAISSHIDALSNWYVRRSRERFWSPETHGIAALDTLREVLTTLAQLLAPYCPFFADMLWRGLELEQAESVHLSDWPSKEPSRREVDLESEMEDARRVVRAGHAARSSSGVAVRQPLREARVAGVDSLRPELVRLVEAELNVKTLSFDDVGAEIRLEPNWRVLGPRFRDTMPIVAAALAELNGAEAAQTLEAGNDITITVNGEQVAIPADAIAVVKSAKKGWAEAEEEGLTVSLDTELDPALKMEGRVRQLVRQIQLARRDNGLHISDRIVLFIGDEFLAYRSAIAGEVLASDVQPLGAGRDAAVVRDEFAFDRAG